MDFCDQASMHKSLQDSWDCFVSLLLLLQSSCRPDQVIMKLAIDISNHSPAISLSQPATLSGSSSVSSLIPTILKNTFNWQYTVSTIALNALNACDSGCPPCNYQMIVLYLKQTSNTFSWGWHEPLISICKLIFKLVLWCESISFCSWESGAKELQLGMATKAHDSLWPGWRNSSYVMCMLPSKCSKSAHSIAIQQSWNCCSRYSNSLPNITDSTDKFWRHIRDMHGSMKTDLKNCSPSLQHDRGELL